MKSSDTRSALLIHALRMENAGLRRQLYAAGARLAIAEQELDAFSYSVSHDLRAPLQAIDGFSGVLEAGHAQGLDAKGRHYLQRIRAGAGHMAQLVDGLLRLSHLGRADVVSQSVDLAQTAQEAFEELREAAAASECLVEIDPSLGQVQGDRLLLRQLYVCLLSNACKFTAGVKGASVAVAVDRPAASEPVWFVRDNGAGFDAASATRLFQPFQRFHHAREYPGIGIGLALAQRIVQRHGGRIWAQAAPGEGAAFYFTLAA